MTPVPVAVSYPVARLASVMRSAGWEIEYIELDLTQQAPKAEIRVRRDDGRWLLARVDELGRASITRFQRDRTLGMTPGTKGRRPLAPQVDDVFLGRSRCLDARHMLRTLTGYLAENAIRPVELGDLRAAWASILGAPVRLAPLGAIGREAT